MNKYKAIELDSDSSEVDETMGPKRCKTPPKDTGLKSNTSNEQTPKTVRISKTEPESAVSGSDSTSPSSSDKTNTSPSSTADATGKTGRNRARKSQHGARRISPDLLFESVALEDGEEGGQSKAPKKVKYEKESTDSQVKVSTAISNLLKRPEMQEVIKRIANERVRCNFMLATYQLPDMNFALNTPMDTLHMQFRERLKQRRDRGNAISTSAAAASTAISQKKSSKGVVKTQKPQP
ncbi:uncharacterized protein LOC108106373 [Drosophila eugracilis]|uniref:uncharacterized protein LOC108106373 n=1 Tax=Drosophila eugracilis TaxID=29029 RepID=UPI0007E881B9|nr:uncharacterized protein LOC108106373 [Drosophila eugracilis]